MAIIPSGAFIGGHPWSTPACQEGDDHHHPRSSLSVVTHSPVYTQHKPPDKRACVKKTTTTRSSEAGTLMVAEAEGEGGWLVGEGGG